MIDAVLSAVDYIEKHLDKPLSISEISSHAGYSQFYFSRIFTDVTRISLYDYLMKRKVSRAMQSIIETPDKIVNIAMDYGFNSHETFSRAFKKHFALTPSEVRALVNVNTVRMQNPLSRDYLESLRCAEVRLVKACKISTYFDWNNGGTSDAELVVFKPGDLLALKCELKGCLSDTEKLLSHHINLQAIASIQIDNVIDAKQFFYEHIDDWPIKVEKYILVKRVKNTFIFYGYFEKSNVN